MYSWLLAINIIGAFLWIIAFIPQIITIHRTNNTYAISALTYFLNAIGGLIMIIFNMTLLLYSKNADIITAIISDTITMFAFVYIIIKKASNINIAKALKITEKEYCIRWLKVHKMIRNQ